jgi:hypothetical protein
MKKMLLSFSLFVCLMLLAAVPAFAQNLGNSMTNGNTMNNYDYRTNNNDSLGNDVRRDVKQGMNRAGRAINNGVYDVERATGLEPTVNSNNYRTNNYRTNGYRAYETTTNKGFSWGWLGLLGLIGLAGMRSRDRDRA